MTTYNGELFLREQFDSILAQTYRNWHLTVSDDGSTDGTDCIIEEYAHLYPDKILHVRYPERFGSPKEHFLQLCRDCEAPLIAFCDQDDVWFPDKLKKMVKLLLEYEQNIPLLIFSDQIPTDAFLNPINNSAMKMGKQFTARIEWQAIIFRNTVTGGACLFNRALVQLACRNENIEDIIMHDWWLAAIAACFGNVVYLNEPTGYYRQHEHNYSQNGPIHRGMPPAETGKHTQEYGNDRDHIGMHAQLFKEPGQDIPYWSCEPYVQPLLGIL